MNVNLDFVRFSRPLLISDLVNHRFDIAIGGIDINDTRLGAPTVSDPSFQCPLALIVRNERADEFRSCKSISNTAGPRIAVFDDPALIRPAKWSISSATLANPPDHSRLAAAHGVNGTNLTTSLMRPHCLFITPPSAPQAACRDGGQRSSR